MKIGDKVRFLSEVGGGIVKGSGEKILYWWKMLMDLYPDADTRVCGDRYG